MADVERLATFLQVQPAVVEQQEWTLLLPALILRATEFENLKSQNVVLEVGLEQANRNAEARVAAVKGQLDATLSELQRTRTHDETSDEVLSTIKTTVESLETQLNESREHVSILRTEVKSLNDEKRQALALVDRQSQAATRYEDEYKSLSDRYHALRRDTADLEVQLHESRTAAAHSQFKEQSIEQEVVILKKNVEWLTGELESKTANFAKYRKETNTLTTTIQQEADAAKSLAASLEVNVESLRKHNTELTSGLEQNLLRVQDLQEQLATKEESFRNEMSTQTRLIQLHERSAKDAKLRISQIERNSEQRLQHDAQEVSRVMQLYDSAQERLEILERQVGALETEAEGLRGELDIANERLNCGDQPNGIGLLSPSAHVISKVQNSGMSLTQLYAEYLSTKQDLEHERRKNDKIQKSFDDLIQELESRAPQLQEQRDEYSHLQIELATMSESNEAMAGEKQALEKQLSSRMVECRDQAREIQLYQQQVIDLSRQVQKLLFEIEEQGFRASPLSEAEVTALNRMLEHESSSNSAVDNLISERLVLFKNIQELQKQNEQQLRITRQLGARMERDEEENRKKFADLESQALSEANDAITSLNRELQTMQTKMESCTKERDMFRRMLSNLNEQQAPEPQAAEANNIQNPTEAIQEVQAQFDAYRNETTIDRNTLTDQLNRMTKERSDLSISTARMKSQLEMAEERHRMLNGSLESMRKEVEESRKRGAQAQEAMAKQDSRAQKIAEELIDHKTHLEVLRAENANYKAEKQLWKSIEERTAEELESLRGERGRLSHLVANLQALQSERERTQGEMTQRYGHQIQSLQDELDGTKARLVEEREEVRRMTLNKDQSSRESHEKIESLLRQVSDAREAHAVANTDKENLKSRCSELEVQLRAAEEKISAISARSITPGANTEQDLHLQVQELRSLLENARSDVKQAQSRAQKMQELATASETALQETSQSHEKLLHSIEEQMQNKSGEIESLHQRVADLLSELESANQELGQIRSTENGKRQELQDEIQSLNAKVESLREVEEKFNIANSYYQEDLRRQAEIAQEAQQNYENELMRHAEAAQSLRALRQDYNEIRDEVLSLRNKAEVADAKLASEGKSWQNQKVLYERELSELRARLTDLQHQNELLHGQFDTYTAHMGHKATESSSDGVPDSDSENVQEIIRYLRREKEIVDVSYEVLQQENKRTKQQLMQTTKSLDELQLTLSTERQKSSQSSITALEHSEVVSKMNELNLIRESNIVLRSENEGNINKIRTLQDEIRALTEKLEPLEAQLRASEAESQAKSEEIALLVQDNERWKQRNQSILQKYERIDPDELQELRNKAVGADKHAEEMQQRLKELETQLAEGKASAVALQEEIDAQSGRYETLMKQSRERIKKERTDAKAALATSQESTAQVESLTQELASLKEELHAKTEENAAAVRASDAALRSEVAALESQLSEKDKALQLQSSTANSELESIKLTIQNLTKERDAALEAKSSTKEETSDGKVAELEQELLEHKAELEKQKANFVKLRAAAKKNKEELQVSMSVVADLQAQLESSKIERNKQADQPQASGISEEDVQKRVTEALAAASPSESEIQTRITEALSAQQLSLKSNDEAVQEKIDEALANHSNASEETIQKRIDEAVAKAKEESATSAAPAESERNIEEIIKAKDEETKVKVRAITKERVDQIVEQRLPKKIEAERQKWLIEAETEKSKAVAEKEAELEKKLEALEQEIREKLKTHGDNVRKESTMRVTLQMKSKDREIAALQKKLAEATGGPPKTATPAVAMSKPSAEAVAVADADAANGKTPDLFDDLSEQSEGDHDEGQVSGAETPTHAAGTARGSAASAANGKGFRGRGGRYQRGAKRGGLLGTKRLREDNDSSDQPAKKAA